jgi:hypothetical protein
MADDADRDAQSSANKFAHLTTIGLVEPLLLQVPLDPDLGEAFSNAWDSAGPLSKTDILLIQVMRLLREMKPNGSSGPDTPAVG